MTYGSSFSSNPGTVFSIATDGSAYSVLHRFAGNADGGYPLEARLIIGTDGKLYGITSGSGQIVTGTIFRIGTDGSAYSVLHVFNRADYPKGGLILDTDGNLYGVTRYGGANSGEIFKFGNDGSGYSSIYSFTLQNESAIPSSGLLISTDGKTLYGVTSAYTGVSAGAFVKSNGTIFSFGLPK